MASSRPRRSNAGAKMASLLNEEEKTLMAQDDFYATTYGGFTETQDDRDFRYHSPQEDDDEVDSDFSIDENDEVRSDLEDEDGEGKKRAKKGAGVVTKAYREPLPKKDREATEKRRAENRQKVKSKKRERTVLLDFGRKEARASTVSKTAETARRQKEREARARKLLRKRLSAKNRRQREEESLTQEELLEEAKVTEKLNLASLKKYEQMELEAKKKAVKLTKRSVNGPFVRYLSTAMPLKEVIGRSYNSSSSVEEKIAVVDDGEEANSSAKDAKEAIEKDDKDEKETEEKSAEEKQIEENEGCVKQERTFFTFSDFDTFRSTFPHKRLKQPQLKICPITRLPAKYFDPVTRLPYANLQAFRFLREHYYNQLELKGDREDPEVAAWLEWRAKNKPAKATASAATTTPTHLTQVTRTPVAFAQLARQQHQQTTGSSTPASTQQHQQGLSALAAAIRTGSAIASAASPGVQQQSVVLPVRTTPLGVSSATVASSGANVSFPLTNVTAALPTQPSPTVLTGQTVKIGGQTAHVNFSGQLPRTMATTTLTAQQLQQLTSSRGHVLSSALQSALRGTGANAAAGAAVPRAQLIARPAVPAAISATQQTLLRTQSLGAGGGHRPQQQQQPQQSNIALQRTVSSATASGGAGPPIALAVANAQPPRSIALGQQTQQQQRAQQQPQPRQQIVVAASGSQARQIVMTNQGGQAVRPGQILQVSQGGQQHQIVVSQSGQFIINPNASKAAGGAGAGAGTN